MEPQKTQAPSAKNAFRATFGFLKSNPAIFLPFFIFAALESVFLFVWFLAPRQPFNIFLAPPIRTFWGERFLHYPTNFLLLPKLGSLSRMFLSVFVGSFLTGAAVAMVVDAQAKGRARLKPALRVAFKKYISLFGIILVITLLFYFSYKAAAALLVKFFVSGHHKLLFIPARIWLGPLSVVINLGLALFVQALFTYTIPALIADNQRLLSAIGRSIVTFKNNFRVTILLVLCPLLLYVPIIVLNYNSPFLIRKVFPESVLLVLFAGIFVSAMVVDLLITVATAFLYLFTREKR